MSMEDAALDMKIEPVDISNKMKDWGYTCPEHSYTHSGFLSQPYIFANTLTMKGPLKKFLVGMDLIHNITSLLLVTL